MRILIDILHPAHVHFFRNFHDEMAGRGHQLCITARAKDRSLDLLDRFGLPYHHLSDQRSGGVGMTVEMAERTARLVRLMRRFRPDVLTGIMGPSIALAGAVRRVPAVVFYDTEFATQTNRFVYPLAHSVCTPDCYQGKVPGTHRRYAGYHELAYLHPNRFQPIPASSVRSVSPPTSPFPSCGSYRGKRSTTAANAGSQRPRSGIWSRSSRATVGSSCRRRRRSRPISLRSRSPAPCMTSII